MGLPLELWSRDLKEEILPSSSFLSFISNFDEWVVPLPDGSGYILNIPQAGASSNVVRNRSVFPAMTESRADSVLAVQMTDYSSMPRRIGRSEEAYLSYDKRMSIIRQDSLRIREEFSRDALFDIAPDTSRVVLTTGTTVAASTIQSGWSGNRRPPIIEDFFRLTERIEADDIPVEECYGVANPVFMRFIRQFFVKDLVPARDLSQEVIARGVVGQLAGINLIPRSNAQQFLANTSLPKAVGAAVDAANDTFGLQVFHPAMVGKAMSGVEYFERERDPNYYGNVVSAMMYGKAAKVRADGRGTYALILANS